MPSTPRRLVLSVGIGDYDRTCLPKLHGSVLDAVSFARTAALTPGFHAQDIVVLKDPSCKDLKLSLLQMQSQISQAPTEVELMLVHLSGELLYCAKPSTFGFAVTSLVSSRGKQTMRISGSKRW